MIKIGVVLSLVIIGTIPSASADERAVPTDPPAPTTARHAGHPRVPRTPRIRRPAEIFPGSTHDGWPTCSGGGFTVAHPPSWHTAATCTMFSVRGFRFPLERQRRPADVVVRWESSFDTARLRWMDVDAPRVLDHREVRIDGKRAVEVESVEGDGTRYAVWIFDTGGRAFVLQLTDERPTMRFNTLRATAQAMAGSVRFRIGG